MTGGPYDDILNLPHHTSPTRPRMSMENRAAQFSPFAALSGYNAAIKETARRTDKRIELTEDAVAELNMKLAMLADRIGEQPEVTVTYFLPDEKKDGGAYVTIEGGVKKINTYAGLLILMDESGIAIGDIVEIECGLFKDTIEGF